VVRPTSLYLCSKALQHYTACHDRRLRLSAQIEKPRIHYKTAEQSAGTRLQRRETA